jgi:hypothetical protein
MKIQKTRQLQLRSEIQRPKSKSDAAHTRFYIERGEQPGCDLDDWLQAERELQRGELGGEQGA